MPLGKKNKWTRDEQVARLESLDQSLDLGIGDIGGFLDFLKTFAPILAKIIAFIMSLNPSGELKPKQKAKLKKLVAAYKAHGAVSGMEFED